MGVSFRGVSACSQSNFRREVGGRVRPSHTALSQLQHAFVHSEVRQTGLYRGAFHVTYQMCL